MMQDLASVDEILDFAIERENEARDFYLSLAKEVSSAHMKKLFESFAAQEQKHADKLLAVKRGGGLKPSDKPVPDLKLSDYLDDSDVSEQIDYQGALVMAMQREKLSFKLYTDLAALAVTPTVKDTLEALAQEEARHKLYLELEYDELILSEN